ncbi:hypothetical protein GGX14DRAFT_342116, partial [Mycena pura]
RFCEVPIFGRFKIRKFHSNVSGMKRLAGRDFEDTLQLIIKQCILPVIEGLGPAACKKYESILTEMWFMMCKWHGLAKLRMHTTSTLELFRQTTTELGDIVRRFQQQT